MKTLKDNHLAFKLELQAALQKTAGARDASYPARGPVPARRVLLCADSGYAHLVAVIPRATQVDLARVSRLLGGSVVTSSPCNCSMGAADFRLDTIVDSSLEGRDFALPDEAGGEIQVQYRDFVQSCHPLVAPIIKL